jgi:hypothetical protein
MKTTLKHTVDFGKWVLLMVLYLYLTSGCSSYTCPTYSKGHQIFNQSTAMTTKESMDDDADTYYEDDMYCPSCGKMYTDETLICQQCGFDATANSIDQKITLPTDKQNIDVASISVLAPHFSAVISHDGRIMCKPCAPILRWALGKTTAEFKVWLDKKQYKYTKLTP